MEEFSAGEAVVEDPASLRRGRASSVQHLPVVGSYVTKNFADGSGTLVGKIVSAGRILAAIYEDGRREELEHGEARRMLQAPTLHDEVELERRKRKIEEVLSEGTARTRSSRRKLDAPSSSSSGRAPAEAQEEKKGRTRRREEHGSHVGELENDVHSSTDSSESMVTLPDDPRLPLSPAEALQALALPASSGDMGIPEELVGCLLSVYCFLRAFSVKLFLSPFSLPEFVNSLVCVTQNSLLDSVHLSLMRTLGRHLEVLSSEGSHAASKCLRCLDWRMIDSFTWPVFLVEYLHMMGWMKGPSWKGFQFGQSEGKEYYSFPLARKLEILQILCDAVLDSDELRAEVDSREEADEEGDFTPDSSLPQQTSVISTTEVVHARRFTRRSSALEEPTSCSNNVSSEVSDKHVFVPQDGNSDECRLCRMDGTLICCDGCPSAYHSRCIGLAKASLPEGLWYCPECTARCITPTFDKVGMGSRGAELFGIDLFGRAFMGSCNFLLVLEASSNTDSTVKYYDQSDVPAVLRLLLSASGYSRVYSDICQEIARYWAIPIDQYRFLEGVPETEAPQKGDPQVKSCPLRAEASKTINPQIKTENVANVTQSALHRFVPLSNLDDDLAAGAVFNETDSVNQLIYTSENGKLLKSSAEKPATSVFGLVEYSKENQPTFADRWSIAKPKVCVDEKLLLGIDQDSDLPSARSFSQPTVLTDLVHQGSDRKESTVLGDVIISVSDGVLESGVLPSGTRTCIVPWKEVSPNPVGCNDTMGREYKNTSSAPLGTPFYPQAYSNQYMLGELAASAAANLVALDAKEGMNKSTLDASSSSLTRRRKFVSASIAMQLKAFSAACSMRFIWTSSERKLLECPRDRCGWCMSCKGATINKKGCLLNLSLVNAVKAGLIRGHVDVRPSPRNFSEKSQVSAIASHILNMETDLFGLLIGPLADPKYNKRWRILVRDASSVGALRPLLLELEKSIRSVAFSAEWSKSIEDWLVERTAKRGPATPIHKRGPGRSKRKSLTSGATPESQTERLMEINWWRGSRVSRILFRRGMLTRSLTKKAAREGGLKSIPGINYSGNPRSQQLAWRVAVEMSRSQSQIALQVRRLDAHIRWKDLVLPDQMPSELTKGTESEYSVFRNAVICSKDASSAGIKVKYAINFGDRKHLPLSVMKNVLEMGADPNGEEKEELWFAENNIPLYLIKAYEERAHREGATPITAGPRRYSTTKEVQRQQLKAFRRDVFSYILHREDYPISCVCSSCPYNVILREAVKCSSCQGYCHTVCIHQGSDPEKSSLCKQCHIALSAETINNGEYGINNKLQPASSSKVKSQLGDLRNGAQHFDSIYHPFHSIFSPSQQLEMMNVVTPSPVSEPRRRNGEGALNHGLVFKRRRKGEDIGEQFRLGHVIRPGEDHSSIRPVCVLCLKEYNPAAMYIRCERCPNWVHAEALMLKEDQLPRLVGFKCGKCRRKGWPRCPYEDNFDLSRKKRKDSVPYSHPSHPQHQLSNTVITRELSLSGPMTMGMDMDLGMTSMGIGMDMNTEMDSEPPQTYFSFTELLSAPEDSLLDVQLEEFLPFVTDNDWVEVSMANSVLACQKCGDRERPAELVCQTCGLAVHVACVPWATTGADLAARPWKCISCRDWE